MVRSLAVLCALVFLPLAASGEPTYSNPVLHGDHPDPSVIRMGDDYWATATTSQWAPIFPLLHSRDLVNWELVGSVFQEPPSWSAGSYWASEIAHHDNRFFIYYTARKKDGPLCVASATSDRPEGPYQDHGPMVCQDAGSIDAVPITDENGRRYLVWKEDGNSRKLPTPLWAQPLSPDGTALVGERRELLRNEAPWEAHLVEGPFILRRNGWFYMFYSADACCGRSCNYKLGVARAKALLGPWERHPRNPILAANDTWKCPGHGSIVSTPDGRDFLLYHAYHAQDFHYAGRQGMLDEITWGVDGWPSINGGRGASLTAPAPLGVAEREPEPQLVDELTGRSLGSGWQWPWNRTPVTGFDAGALVLRASGDGSSAADTIVARPTESRNYTATARVRAPLASNGDMAGLAAFGNAENALGISFTGGAVVVWMREKGEQRPLARADLTKAGPSVDLRMTATEGRRFQFAYSTNGVEWHALGGEADGGYLPPWDLAVRVALTVGGRAGAEAQFDWIRIETHDRAARAGSD